MIRKIIPLSRRGDVTFHADGRIDITAHVSKKLDLHSGDVVNIATSDDNPPEHFLFVARRNSHTIGRHAGTCKPAKGTGNYLRVHSKQLASHILTICHATESVTLCVGEVVSVEGLGTALPLITAPFRQRMTGITILG